MPSVKPSTDFIDQFDLGAISFNTLIGEEPIKQVGQPKGQAPSHNTEAKDRIEPITQTSADDQVNEWDTVSAGPSPMAIRNPDKISTTKPRFAGTSEPRILDDNLGTARPRAALSKPVNGHTANESFERAQFTPRVKLPDGVVHTYRTQSASNFNGTNSTNLRDRLEQASIQQKRPSRHSPKNVFEAILLYGHDEDFIPIADENFLPTDAPAGSTEKLEVLKRRVELGQPLWHPNDRVDYAGLVGAIRPRET